MHSERLNGQDVGLCGTFAIQFSSGSPRSGVAYVTDENCDALRAELEVVLQNDLWRQQWSLLQLRDVREAIELLQRGPAVNPPPARGWVPLGYGNVPLVRARRVRGRRIDIFGEDSGYESEEDRAIYLD